MAVDAPCVHIFRVPKSLLFQTIRHFIVHTDMGMPRLIQGDFGQTIISAVLLPGAPESFLLREFRICNTSYEIVLAWSSAETRAEGIFVHFPTGSIQRETGASPDTVYTTLSTRTRE